MSTATLAQPVSQPRARSASQTASGRLEFLDIYRGLLTVLMALDHAVYFLWAGAEEHSFTFWEGPFVSDEGPGELAVRLLSNLAAPGFFLLLGVGLAFYAQSRRKLGWSDAAIARHFVVRGALLIAMQFAVENPLWGLRPGASWPNYVGVLFALGGAMLCSAALWRLPPWALAAVGACILPLQEIVLRTVPLDSEALPLWLSLLLVPGESSAAIVYFSCLPWLGIAAWGLAFGKLLIADRERTLRGAAIVGGLLFSAAVVIVAARGFGNLGIVNTGSPADMLDFVKYGPSAAFVLWNVGLTLAALPWLAKLIGPAAHSAGPLASFGRSALFFYVAHLLLFGLVAQAIGPSGLSLHGALWVWLAGLMALWPACNLYARFKAATPPDSVWRLF